jgi:hypothetical protein
MEETRATRAGPWRRTWSVVAILGVAVVLALLFHRRGSPMAAMLIVVDGMILAGYAFRRIRSR